MKFIILIIIFIISLCNGIQECRSTVNCDNCIKKRQCGWCEDKTQPNNGVCVYGTLLEPNAYVQSACSGQNSTYLQKHWNYRSCPSASEPKTIKDIRNYFNNQKSQTVRGLPNGEFRLTVKSAEALIKDAASLHPKLTSYTPTQPPKHTNITNTTMLNEANKLAKKEHIKFCKMGKIKKKDCHDPSSAEQELQQMDLKRLELLKQIDDTNKKLDEQRKEVLLLTNDEDKLRNTILASVKVNDTLPKRNQTLTKTLIVGQTDAAVQRERVKNNYKNMQDSLYKYAYSLETIQDAHDGKDPPTLCKDNDQICKDALLAHVLKDVKPQLDKEGLTKNILHDETDHTFMSNIQHLLHTDNDEKKM